MTSNPFLKAVSFLICFLLVSSIETTSANAIENPYKNHYPFNTAIIHYKVTGYETGKETLYVNSNFKALYIDTQYKYLGKLKSKKVLVLTTPEYIYNIDLNKKSGTKVKNLKKELIMAFDHMSDGEKITVKKNVEELGTAIVGNIHGKRVAAFKEILEISCDLIEVNGERALIWPGVNIPLKKNRKSEYDDKIVVTAVNIEKNIKIAREKFKIPDGIAVTFDKTKNEILENKFLTQFHSMRNPGAVKRAKEEIARMVINKRLVLNDVDAEIPKDIDDSIFADQELLKNVHVIYEIQYSDELPEDGEIFEFE